MSYSYTVPAPFHLPRVLKTHGWFQLLPFRWVESRKVLLWAMRFPDGLQLLVRLSGGVAARAGRVRLRIDTGGRQLSLARQRELKRSLAYIFNLDLDLGEFYSLCRGHPVLSAVAHRGMGRILRAPSFFEDLVKGICGTNCTWKQAVGMINRLGALGDEVGGAEDLLGGERLRVFPGPQNILDAGKDYLRSMARLGYRSDYVLELCRRKVEGDEDLIRLEKETLGREEMERILLSLPGIGPVTARYLLALHGHFERIAVDSLVLSFAARTYFGGRRPLPHEVEALYEPFGRWRYLAYWMEFILRGGWDPGRP